MLAIWMIDNDVVLSISQWSPKASWRPGHSVGRALWWFITFTIKEEKKLYPLIFMVYPPIASSQVVS